VAIDYRRSLEPSRARVVRFVVSTHRRLHGDAFSVSYLARAIVACRIEIRAGNTLTGSKPGNSFLCRACRAQTALTITARPPDAGIADKKFAGAFPTLTLLPTNTYDKMSLCTLCNQCILADPPPSSSGFTSQHACVLPIHQFAKEPHHARLIANDVIFRPHA
jgi:hypothetical protein